MLHQLLHQHQFRKLHLFILQPPQQSYLPLCK